MAYYYLAGAEAMAYLYIFMQVGDAAPGAARVQRELMGKESRCYGTADVPWRYNEGSPASL